MSDNHVCILRTGKLFEHDIAANVLKDNNIPFYKQAESSSGLRLAMPFQPAMGPGIFYNILVPKQFEENAREILKELPIEVTTDPDVWHFGATPREKWGWKLFAWIILALIALGFLSNFLI